jgi:hypothetical protein
MTRPLSSIEYIEFNSKPLIDILHLTPPPLLPAEPFRQLLYIEEHVRKLGCQTVLLEPHYIDRHYIEDHSILYSKNFLSLPNYCKRLHFFSLNSTQIQAKLKAILDLGACRFKSLSTLSTRYSLEFSVSNVLVSVTRIVFGRSKLIRGTKRVLFGAPSGALVVSSRLQTTLAAE